MIQADGQGLRFSTGKPRPDLTPPEFQMALGRHYFVGSLKYAERNWERGMKWGDCLGPLLRHVLKFMMGERYDKETGSHHMVCAAWNCAALFTYDLRGLGENDATLPLPEEKCLIWVELTEEEVAVLKAYKQQKAA